MSQRIPVQQLDKPPMGTPCNGCGLCCIEQVCDLGVELGDSVHCKALIENPDASFSCGLVVDPYRFLPEDRLKPWRAIDHLSGDERYGEASLKSFFVDILGAGKGCDSLDS